MKLLLCSILAFGYPNALLAKTFMKQVYMSENERFLLLNHRLH